MESPGAYRLQLGDSIAVPSSQGSGAREGNLPKDAGGGVGIGMGSLRWNILHPRYSRPAPGKTGIRGPTKCVSKSCAGPLHRLDRQPTTPRATPVTAAAFPHTANFKLSHWTGAGVSESRIMKPAGRSIPLGPPRRHSEFPAVIPRLWAPKHFLC